MCHTVNDTHICINETFESTNNQIGIYVHETFKPCVREHLPYLHLTPRMTENSLFILPMLSLYIHNDQPPVAWNGGTGKTISREVIQSFCQPAQDMQVGL